MKRLLVLFLILFFISFGFSENISNYNNISYSETQNNQNQGEVNFLESYIFPNLHYYIGFLLLIIGFLVTNRVSPYLKRQNISYIYFLFIKLVFIVLPVFFIFFILSMIDFTKIISSTILIYFLLFLYFYNFQKDFLEYKTKLQEFFFAFSLLFLLGLNYQLFHFIDNIISIYLKIVIILFYIFISTLFIFSDFYKKKKLIFSLKNSNSEIEAEIIKEDSSFIQVKSENKSYYIKKEDVEYVEEIENEK